MNNVTLGDLVGTNGDPAVDALLDRTPGTTKFKPEPIVVKTSHNVFQWSNQVETSYEGVTVPVPQIA